MLISCYHIKFSFLINNLLNKKSKLCFYVFSAYNFYCRALSVLLAFSVSVYSSEYNYSSVQSRYSFRYRPVTQLNSLATPEYSLAAHLNNPTVVQLSSAFPQPPQAPRNNKDFFEALSYKKNSFCLHHSSSELSDYEVATPNNDQIPKSNYDLGKRVRQSDVSQKTLLDKIKQLTSKTILSPKHESTGKHTTFHLLFSISSSIQVLCRCVVFQKFFNFILFDMSVLSIMHQLNVTFALAQQWALQIPPMCLWQVHTCNRQDRVYQLSDL